MSTTPPLKGSQYASQTFTGITASRWSAICTSVLLSTGINMSQNLGTEDIPAKASKNGITIEWVCNLNTGVLTIDLQQRKFFDPGEQEIDQRIAKWISSVSA
jgi:hypothetical protein